MPCLGIPPESINNTWTNNILTGCLSLTFLIKMKLVKYMSYFLRWHYPDQVQRVFSQPYWAPPESFSD